MRWCYLNVQQFFPVRYIIYLKLQDYLQMCDKKEPIGEWFKSYFFPFINEEWAALFRFAWLAIFQEWWNWNNCEELKMLRDTHGPGIWDEVCYEEAAPSPSSECLRAMRQGWGRDTGHGRDFRTDPGVTHISLLGVRNENSLSSSSFRHVMLQYFGIFQPSSGIMMTY